MSKAKLYKAAIYLRLSKEDGDKEESYSISNQRDLAMDFLSKNTDIRLVEEMVDDGYSGSNFNRPNFQRMIEKITVGEINCVIVKDLSRFARDYIGSGYYLEKLFPAMGVRFISINDRIDYKIDDGSNTRLIDKFIRLHSECPDCNSTLKRQHQGHDEKTWTAYKCTNPVCPAKSIKENRLYQLITEMTNHLIQNLDLANEPTITEIPDDTLADDKANEIYIKMAGEYDKDDVLKSLYELARLKFQSSTITDMSAVTEKIKKELCKYGNCEKVPLPLMQKIVSKFYVGGDNELKMKLINGKIITRSVI